MVFLAAPVAHLRRRAAPIHILPIKRPVAYEAVLESGVAGDGLCDFGGGTESVEALYFFGRERAVVYADVVNIPSPLGTCGRNPSYDPPPESLTLPT